MEELRPDEVINSQSAKLPSTRIYKLFNKIKHLGKTKCFFYECTFDARF